MNTHSWKVYDRPVEDGAVADMIGKIVSAQLRLSGSDRGRELLYLSRGNQRAVPVIDVHRTLPGLAVGAMNLRSAIRQRIDFLLRAPVATETDYQHETDSRQYEEAHDTQRQEPVELFTPVDTACSHFAP